MFSEFNELTDKELIEKAKKVLEVKDLKLLADELDIPHPTLAKWSSTGTISKNGTGRQYLILFIKFKEMEKELAEYKNFPNSDSCKNLILAMDHFKDDIRKMK